jgi:hypothetical protein
MREATLRFLTSFVAAVASCGVTAHLAAALEAGEEPTAGLEVEAPREPVTLAGLSDHEIERILENGEIRITTDMGKAGWGAVKLLWVEHGGRTLGAVFKTTDYRPTAAHEQDLHDSYRYERAAYLLDRLLEINMVPVVVLREAGGEKGAAIAYVGGAVTAQEWLEEESLSENQRLRNQIASMQLFDALIANRRTASRLLLTTYDERLHLIGHFGGFGTETSLPEAFLSSPTVIAPGILQKLRDLDLEQVSTLLEGLVNTPRMRALLARRDKILDKIEQDRQRLGDGAVPLRDER